VLALLHSPDDNFTSTQVVVDLLSPAERKAAHKNLHIVQFTGTLPPSFPMMMSLRLYGLADREYLNDLVLNLASYTGKVRLLLPKDLKLRDPIDQSLVGLKRQEPIRGFDDYVKRKLALLKEQASRKVFEPKWCRDLARAVPKVQGQPVYLATDNKKPVELRRIVLSPGRYYTIFLAIDRPPNARIGSEIEFDVYQRDSEKGTPFGGSTYRVQIVKAPPRRVRFDISGARARAGEQVVVRLTDDAGNPLSPSDKVEVGLFAHDEHGPEDTMRRVPYNRTLKAWALASKRPAHTRLDAVKVTVLARLESQEQSETKTVLFKPDSGRSGKRA
jgi:hypothetical protein